MNITKDKVVTINYTLKDNKDVVLDSSDGQGPLAYLHGNKNLIPGMEQALEGKTTGDKFDTVVKPEEGYGLRNEAMINEVPLANFPDSAQVKVGAQFQADTPEGVRVARVVAVDGETVSVDFNHPLADMTLYFNIEVNEIRDATEEEISHGHVHQAEAGSDCCDGH
ncbi:MAG: FKBP-type peptidyl-prolyl cis-trans isomerase SlyD [Candidatus Omnitrophota bacterium]|jgi:FKBP-type peptidyl-prolyl cis-trans isomerase SlyD